MGNRQITDHLGWSQVAAFRLARHHLIDRAAADLEEICRDLCGVQAQVMSSAELACWTRTAGIASATLHAALWKSRTLVRTSCMRQTLHLLPAADFSIYINALKRSRLAALLRGMARFGMTARDMDGLNRLVMEELHSGPRSQRDLAQAIRPRVNKKVQAWMERFWSPVRPAVVEGLVCYGYGQDLGEGNSKGRRSDAVFVRVDQWLPKQKEVDESIAQQTLLRSYMRTYGPATVQDFAFWSGIGMKESRDIWISVAPGLAEVSIEGHKKSILSHDLDELAASSIEEDVVRLLPGFDPYLLAHAKKDHMVKDQHYKRVYRNQGWITPVVLINGRVAGIWLCTRKGKALSFKAEIFEKLSKRQRSKIQEEAESLACFLDGSIAIEIR